MRRTRAWTRSVQTRGYRPEAAAAFPERHRRGGFGFHLSPWSPVETIRASTNERSNWFGRFTMLRLSLLTNGATHGELARAHHYVSSA